MPRDRRCRTPRQYDSARLEATARLPRGWRGLVGDALHQLVEEAVEVGRGLEVHRLLQVVLRLVIAGAVPLPVDPLARRARSVAEHERGRRNAGFQEVPLIGALQQVALRLRVLL